MFPSIRQFNFSLEIPCGLCKEEKIKGETKESGKILTLRPCMQTFSAGQKSHNNFSHNKIKYSVPPSPWVFPRSDYWIIDSDDHKSKL